MTGLSTLGHAVNDLIQGLRCDGYGTDAVLRCGQAPLWTVQIEIPAVKKISVGPLCRMTTLHYCSTHRDALRGLDTVFVWNYLTVPLIAELEQQARERWGSDVRVFFDDAHIHWIRVRTPEYRRYLGSMLRAMRENRHGRAGIHSPAV